ncbi:MAG: haloacid dehalogenase [Piscirickettsiaceae bacterium]|nr:MAG: haloacid dehalogenase [Piscirickettsiaceae bacterium]
MVLSLGNSSIEAVLFDLDGTLLDTAPDLAFALNSTRITRQLKTLELSSIRPHVSYGADGMIKHAYGDTISSEMHKKIKAELISCYEKNIANKTQLFSGLSVSLAHLDAVNMPWGIVTNKPRHLTLPLLKALNLYDRATCIVCGDDVENTKPHPESIHLACKLINISADKAVYIGDAKRDIQAGNSAGNKTIACQFGYIPPSEDIHTWHASAIAKTSSHLSDWLLTLK